MSRIRLIYKNTNMQTTDRQAMDGSRLQKTIHQIHRHFLIAEQDAIDERNTPFLYMSFNNCI